MRPGQYASFCTEDMARRLLFLPVELAPGHLVDSRAIQDAVYRMRAATAKLTTNENPTPAQGDLFA